MLAAIFSLTLLGTLLGLGLGFADQAFRSNQQSAGR